MTFLAGLGAGMILSAVIIQTRLSLVARRKRKIAIVLPSLPRGVDEYLRRVR